MCTREYSSDYCNSEAHCYTTRGYYLWRETRFFPLWILKKLSVLSSVLSDEHGVLETQGVCGRTELD